MAKFVQDLLTEGEGDCGNIVSCFGYAVIP
jgi:hypothetical protein